MAAFLDPLEFDARAVAATRSRLVPVTIADLDRPSVCAGWTVRGILSHLVGGNRRFAQALRGERPDWASRDEEPVTSPLEEFDSSAADMAAAVAATDGSLRAVHLPAGEPPALFAVAVHATDMLIHGWDLAVSTGQACGLEPDLCQAGLAVIEKYPASFWGEHRFFASRAEAPSADPQTRLLLLTGRDPTATSAQA